MAGIKPLTRQDVPIRKIRDAINLLVDQINMQRPIADGGLELHPNGFTVKGSKGEAGEDYVPPFSPQIGSPDANGDRTLLPTPGYFHAPKSNAGTYDIHNHVQYAWMPEIDGVAIDSDTPNYLSLRAAKTSYVTLRVNYTTRNVVVGGTEPSGATNDPGVYVETETGDWAIVPLGANFYHIDSLVEAPNFHVTEDPTPDDFPEDTETLKYLPFGKFVLDVSGNITTEEWYWTGHRSMVPDSFYYGRTGDDNTANPIVEP